MFRLAFVVNESGFNSTASNFFPAYELIEQLSALYGHKIDIVTPSLWNKPEVFDKHHFVIILAEDFPAHVAKKPCVAWLRKSLDTWVAKPDIHLYRIIFVASQRGQEYIKEKTGKPSVVLPHAVGEQFKPSESHNTYASDYCFVGNHTPGKTRQIATMLEPYELGYKFRLYGHRWEEHTRWQPYWKGPVDYCNLPKVFSSTKIVIDDAESWGCVNSRVFNALSCGALVLTNDMIGNIDTFQCQLPVYRNKEELVWLIRYYLTHEEERTTLVKRLQVFVTNHTYYCRAKKFQEVLFQHANRH